MPKIQAVTAMTLDGFLPDAADMSMRWVMNHRKGFAHWRERCDARIYPIPFWTCFAKKTAKAIPLPIWPKFPIPNRWNCSEGFPFTTSWTN